MSDRCFKTSRLVGGAIAFLLGISWGGFVREGAIVLAQTQPQNLIDSNSSMTSNLSLW
jgi:hypothetical protein